VGCTRLILLRWLYRAERMMLKAFPPHDGKEHGVFATRSPNRPNPISVGIIELLECDGENPKARGYNAIKGPPRLYIKPGFPEVDRVPSATVG